MSAVGGGQQGRARQFIEWVQPMPHLVGLMVGIIVAAMVVRGAVVLAGHAGRPRQGERARLKRGISERGFATRWELWRSVSLRAARRKCKFVRPTWGRNPFHLPRFLPPDEAGVELGRGRGGRRLFVAFGDTLLGLAPPQTGKTNLLSWIIVRAPGAVLTTSTKIETYLMTRVHREKKGAVHLFNPQRLGDEPSTFRWNFLQGCEEPQVAAARAAAMVHEAGGDARSVKDKIWDNTSMAIATFAFTVAARLGMSVAEMAPWLFMRDMQQLRNFIRDDATLPEGWLKRMDGILKLAPETSGSVGFTMADAFGFLQDPRVLAACAPAPGAGFDFQRFIESRETVYLVAEGNSAYSVGPLFAAFTTQMFATARVLAQQPHPAVARRAPRWLRAGSIGRLLDRLGAGWFAHPANPGGKLDPPMIFALDEVKQTCPVPLPTWVADSAGIGVFIASMFHSFSQIAELWGAEGATTVWGASTFKVLFPGGTVPEDLRRVSELCGERPVASRSDSSGDGKSSVTRDANAKLEPVVTVDQLRRMSNGCVLALSRGLRPFVVKVPWYHKSKQARQARKDMARRRAAASLPSVPLTASPTMQEAFDDAA